MNAGSLELELLANVARLSQDLRKAEQMVGGFASSATRALDSVKTAFGALGVGLSVGALAAWVKTAVDAADEASKLSQKLGVATKDIAGLELAFKLGGAGSEAMTGAISRLSKGIVTGNDALKALGIATKTTSGEFRSTMEVLYDTADVFAKMPDGIQKTALASEAFGKDLGSRLIPVLNGGSQGLRDMAEMAQKLGLVIDDETGKKAEAFNDTLDLIGMGSQGVARGIAAQLLPTLESLAGSFLTSMTEGDKLKNTANFLASGLKILYGAAVAVVEAFSTAGKVLGGVTGIIVAALRGDFSEARNIFTAMKTDIGASWASTASMIKKAWNEEGDAAISAAVKANAAGKDMLAAVKAREEAAKKAAAQAKKDAEDFAKLYAKLTGQEMGVDPDFIANLKLIATEGKKAGLSLAEIVRVQEKYIAQQPYMVKQEKEALEIAKERQKLRNDEYAQAVAAVDAQLAEAQAAARAAEAAVKAAQDEYDQRDMLASQIAQVTLARIYDRLQTKEAGSAAFEAVMREIRAQEQLIEVLRKGEAAAEVKKTGEEQLRIWNSIEETARSVWTNIWEGGSNIFKKLGQVLKASVLDLLYQLTVRKWMISIGTSMGIPGAAMAQGAGANMLGSAMSSWLAPAGGIIDSALGMFGMGSGIGGAAIAGVEIAGTVAATETALAALGAGAGEAAAAAAALGESMAIGTSAMSGLTTALSAIPVWGWVAAAALAVFGLSKKGGGPKVDGSFGYTASDIGIGGTTAGLNQAAMQTVAGLTFQFEALTKTLGVVNSGVRFGVGISTDPQGDSPSFLDFTASRDGAAIWHRLNRDVGRDEDELRDAMQMMAAQAIVGALQGISGQLPQTISKLLEGVEASTLSTDGATQLVQKIQQIAGAVAQFGAVAQALPFAELRDLTFDAKAGLIEMAGGIDALTSNLQAYYNLVATEEEKRANVARNISNTLQAAGLNISEAQVLAAANSENAKQHFRDLANELGEGSPLWVALIGVSEAFASIIKEAEKLQQVQLGDVIESFLPPEQVRQYRAGLIVDQFNAETGAGVTIEQVLGIGRDEFRNLFLEFSAAGNTAMTNALLNVAGLFASITEPLEDFKEEVETVSETLKGLQREGQNLDVQILEALGMDDQAKQLLRDIETAGMTPEEIAQYDTNQGKRDLLAQIFKDVETLEDAERRLNAARKEQLRAAEELRQAWIRLGESMMDEVRRLRGQINSSNPAQSFAYLQSQFTLAIAAANAGDLKAGERALGLSRSVEEAALQSVGSLAELNTIRAGLALSLESIATTRGEQSKDGAIVTELRENRFVMGEQRDEIRDLRKEINEANKRIAGLIQTATGIVEDWDNNGMPAERED